MKSAVRLLIKVDIKMYGAYFENKPYQMTIAERNVTHHLYVHFREKEHQKRDRLGQQATLNQIIFVEKCKTNNND